VLARICRVRQLAPFRPKFGPPWRLVRIMQMKGVDYLERERIRGAVHATLTVDCRGNAVS